VRGGLIIGMNASSVGGRGFYFILLRTYSFKIDKREKKT